MNLLGRKISLLLILFVFCLINSTCRKVNKKHSGYIGEWISQKQFYDCTTYVKIQDNNNGSYGSSGNIDGCGHNWNGKARISGNYLYIGIIKLHILQKPIYQDDSLFYLEGSYYKTKVFASMIVKTTFLHNSATYKLYKIK